MQIICKLYELHIKLKSVKITWIVLDIIFYFLKKEFSVNI